MKKCLSLTAISDPDLSPVDQDHGQAEFREANFFPVEIFCNLNRVSDSVNDAESNDIKILT